MPIDTQFPAWMTKQVTDVPAYMLESEKAAEGIGRNFLSGMQLAQQKDQHKEEMVLKVQEQAVRGAESKARIAGMENNNVVSGFRAGDIKQGHEEASAWILAERERKARIANNVPTGQEEGNPDPQRIEPMTPLPTSTVGKMLVQKQAEADSLPELMALQAELSAEKLWAMPEAKARLFRYVEERPWMAGTPALSQALTQAQTATKAAEAGDMLKAKEAQATALQTQKDAAAMERVKASGSVTGKPTAAMKNTADFVRWDEMAKDETLTPEERAHAAERAKAMGGQIGMKEAPKVEWTTAPDGGQLMTFGRQIRYFAKKVPDGDKIQMQTLGKQMVTDNVALLRKEATPEEKTDARKSLMRHQAAFDSLSNKHGAVDRTPAAEDPKAMGGYEIGKQYGNLRYLGGAANDKSSWEEAK